MIDLKKSFFNYEFLVMNDEEWPSGRVNRRTPSPQGGLEGGLGEVAAVRPPPFGGIRGGLFFLATNIHKKPE